MEKVVFPTKQVDWLLKFFEREVQRTGKSNTYLAKLWEDS